MRSPTNINLAAFLLLATSSAGCAPALSSMQPAHVAPKHHVQAEIGMDVSVPTGTIGKAIDAGYVLADRAQSEKLTDEQINTLYEAGSALALNPPSATPHFGIGFTVIDDLEISARYSTNALRVGGRYQFLHKERHKVDASVGLGLGYYVLGIPGGDLLKVVELDDFSRFQIDVPLVFGTHGSWYRLWGGPRFMYTHFGIDLNLALPAITDIAYPGLREVASFSGNGYYIGGQGGVAVGYKYVFLAFELTMVELLMSGDLSVLKQTRATLDLDSFIVYPAIGLMGEF